MTTPKRPRKAATTTKKPRRATTARPRTRKTKTAAPVADDPLEVVAAAPEPEPEAPLLAIDEAPLEEAPVENEVIITSNPEPGFVARVPPPEPPRIRPSVRRGIFFDVENTSRSADISRVLEHLDIDWVGHATEFMAVGNWRVIGHDTARLLARKGAALVHSAPSVGVRDWSDLRIAVAAGVWLAGARPGDVVEIVSDDQAFDAVGDVAASLGVLFRRTSYRALAGMRHEAVVEREVTQAPASDNRARGRGGRGRSRRSGGRDERRPSRPAVAAAPRPAPTPVDAEPMQTAPHDEIVGVVRDLLEKAPGGVSLDALANALRERGFSRPPGSPRLITRLRRIKELDINRQGTIRIVDPDAAPLRHENRAPAPRHDVEPVDEADLGELAHPLELNEHGVAEPDPEPIEVDAELVAADSGDFDDEAEGDGGPDDGAPEGAAVEGAAGEAGEGGARRRRRRGGRRRRGRRGGASAAAIAPVEGV